MQTLPFQKVLKIISTISTTLIYLFNIFYEMTTYPSSHPHPLPNHLRALLGRLKFYKIVSLGSGWGRGMVEMGCLLLRVPGPHTNRVVWRITLKRQQQGQFHCVVLDHALERSLIRKYPKFRPASLKSGSDPVVKKKCLIYLDHQKAADLSMTRL